MKKEKLVLNLEHQIENSFQMDEVVSEISKQNDSMDSNIHFNNSFHIQISLLSIEYFCLPNSENTSSISYSPLC